MSDQSVQERYAPENICFGCGPANPKGLRIRSFEEGDTLIADWMPESHHQAFPGALNGGIVGALLDCHSNWCAALHLKTRRGSSELPSTVTAEYSVKMMAPTPSTTSLRLRARVIESSDRKAVIEASLESEGRVTATCRGVFVAVEPGHPAYHRW